MPLQDRRIHFGVRYLWSQPVWSQPISLLYAKDLLLFAEFC
jgi:hypothetical protein